MALPWEASLRMVGSGEIEDLNPSACFILGSHLQACFHNGGTQKYTPFYLCLWLIPGGVTSAEGG